jgi:hypothetical protein
MRPEDAAELVADGATLLVGGFMALAPRTA